MLVKQLMTAATKPSSCRRSGEPYSTPLLTYMNELFFWFVALSRLLWFFCARLLSFSCPVFIRGFPFPHSLSVSVAFTVKLHNCILFLVCNIPWYLSANIVIVQFPPMLSWLHSTLVLCFILFSYVLVSQTSGLFSTFPWALVAGSSVSIVL